MVLRHAFVSVNPVNPDTAHVAGRLPIIHAAAWAASDPVSSCTLRFESCAILATPYPQADLDLLHWLHAHALAVAIAGATGDGVTGVLHVV